MDDSYESVARENHEGAVERNHEWDMDKGDNDEPTFEKGEDVPIDVKDQEQEVKDAKEALKMAKEELEDAEVWLTKQEERYRSEVQILEKLKQEHGHNN